MTNQQLTRHYLICLLSAIAAGYYIHPAAAILAFVVTSALLTFDSETRYRK